MLKQRRRQLCANTRVPVTFELLLREALKTLPELPSYNHLKAECFSKFVSSETDAPEIRRQRAIFKWMCAESNNQSTNERLLTVDPEYLLLPGTTWSSFINKLQSIVISIIGEVPPDDAIFGGFSSGASTSRMRAVGHPSYKFVGEAHVTPRALSHGISVIIDAPVWIRYGNISISEVPGNLVFTVPKNAEIDRVAAKEPDLNMFMQRGIGSFIRSRLKRCGIDLRDQSRNRLLAQHGSLTGDLCTLDLASASDSITTMLCLEVLPICWYTLLSDLRSPITNIDGYEHTNEMFSSMGNGFTFELESLLFYSIARTVAYFEGISGIISVYGDDIIAPTALATSLIDVLGFLGFSTNIEKSFVSGPFRESCGGHFINGLDITPFYVRRPITTLIDLIEVLNKIRWWCDKEGEHGILCPSLESIWTFGRDQVPTQLWGGRDYGSTSSLVTYGSGSHQLVPKVIRYRGGIGSYIHRLSVLGDVPDLTSLIRPTGKYEMRKVRTWSSPRPNPFPFEVID